jgi:hypothetical protein
MTYGPNGQRTLQKDVSLGFWAPEESIHHQGFEYKEKLHKIAPQQDCSRSMPFYMCAGKSLAQPGRKQATATEDFDVHISYL